MNEELFLGYSKRAINYRKYFYPGSYKYGKLIIEHLFYKSCYDFSSDEPHLSIFRIWVLKDSNCFWGCKSKMSETKGIKVYDDEFGWIKEGEWIRDFYKMVEERIKKKEKEKIDHEKYLKDKFKEACCKCKKKQEEKQKILDNY